MPGLQFKQGDEIQAGPWAFDEFIPAGESATLYQLKCCGKSCNRVMGIILTRQPAQAERELFILCVACSQDACGSLSVFYDA